MRSLLLTLAFGMLALSPMVRAQDTPAYPEVVLFVSNLQGGDENGYTTEISKPTGMFKCGREPYESEVMWKFIERSPKGDVYELTQSFPESKQASVSKTVVYDNAPLEVWKEDHRVVILKPKGS